jgi:pilus assembly protein CpaF
VGIDAHGRRRTLEIASVPGRVENDLIEVEPLFEQVEDRLVRRSGLPPRPERFTRAGYDVQRLLHESVDDQEPVALHVGELG